MVASTRDLILILEAYFEPNTPLQVALYSLLVLWALVPILHLHRNQQRTRGIVNTGWKTSLLPILLRILHIGNTEPLSEREVFGLYNDLPMLSELLGMESRPICQTRPVPIVLCSPHVDCVVCWQNDAVRRSLRKREKPWSVRVLASDLTMRLGFLLPAHCPHCHSNYFPDCYTIRDQQGGRERKQVLEIDAPYLRISKTGVWADRKVAVMQQQAILRFHAGWASFSNWVNDQTTPRKELLTIRQSQRLFIEHLGRRLLKMHDKENSHLPPHANSQSLAGAIRDIIGSGCGRIMAAMEHGCTECTHHKRFKEDLVAEGFEFQVLLGDQIAGLEGGGGGVNDSLESAVPPPPRQQSAPPPGSLRGFIRLAVMDGKTLGHRICATPDCKNPLVNYKNGRFCQEHMHLMGRCGILSCNAPATTDSPTCNDLAHQRFYQKFKERFARLSFPGVQRAMRRNEAVNSDSRTSDQDGSSFPTITVDLPAIGNESGSNVKHTFQARKVYCILTLQWSCGYPIGWGKCYSSESTPQVLRLLDLIWEGVPDRAPSFLAYDNACNLLRYIFNHNITTPWFRTTRFIVDAWHYIGHKATDALCRKWCNPAPANGSQPDLIRISEDLTGRKVQTRAFNTETAEQFNSWLDGFEAHTRGMTESMFDFFIHSLMLIYLNSVEDRIKQKGNDLPENFFEARYHPVARV